MFGRQIWTLFDLLQPDLFTKASKKQEEQTKSLNGKAKDRPFYQGDYVYVKRFSHRNSVPWITGVIVKRIGNVSYMERNTDNVVKRHVNHICKEIVGIILKVINGHQIIKGEVKIPEDLRNGGERHYASRLHQPPQCFRDEFYN